jgi:hypothetical protein
MAAIYEPREYWYSLLYSLELIYLKRSPRSAQTSSNGANEVRVSAVGSASSDGLILVIKLEP